MIPLLPREIRKYLFDISEACDNIIQFTSGKIFSDYQTDPMLRSAVERQFEIIGEALNQALQQMPILSEKISNTRQIISFRNRLIHGYASVSDEVVWGIIETQLPLLSREVKELLTK